MMSSSPDEKFLDVANPFAWLQVADNLHEQATVLSRRSGGIVQRSDASGVTGRWKSTNRSVFLLGGFALENALKAFLVFEFPEFVAGGRLSRKLKTHSLTALRSMSNLAPYPSRYRWVLADFERGLESWARYPCATTVAASEDERVLPDRLWVGYQFLMRGYGRALVKLLATGWRGPLGYYGNWTFTGTYLGATL